MIKQLLFLVTFGALASYAQELKIISDNFKGDQSKGISIFTGNVKVTKGSDELNASKVTIYTNSTRKPIKYVAEGDVSFYIVTQIKERYRGQAQTVVYLPNESEYQFTKKVDLIRLDDYRRIKGDKVVLNEEKGFANADSIGDEPVVMIFTLDDKKETKKGSKK